MVLLTDVLFSMLVVCRLVCWLMWCVGLSIGRLVVSCFVWLTG